MQDILTSTMFPFLLLSVRRAQNLCNSQWFLHVFYYIDSISMKGSFDVSVCYGMLSNPNVPTLWDKPRMIEECKHGRWKLSCFSGSSLPAARSWRNNSKIKRAAEDVQYHKKTSWFALVITAFQQIILNFKIKEYWEIVACSAHWTKA